MAVETPQTQKAPPPAAPEQAVEPPHSGWILLVACVAQFMVILDLSIVNVALPHIQDALNISSADLIWVVDTYAILFASFLMLAGRMADHFGQRRVFVAALVLFGVTSAFGGAAQSGLWLFIARGVQGFSCAFMAASSLAIITSSFPPGPKLHRAIALWAAMNGLGGAAGALFGGIITQELTWRWIFFINPPIAAVIAVIAWIVVRDRPRDTPGFDLAGAATLTIGQIVLVYGVVEAGIVSWHAALAFIPILVGLAILMLFNVIEARWAKAPLIPFKQLTRQLNVANLIVILFSASLFPMWYASSLYLQFVLGLSPLKTGLTFLPMALVIMAVASRAGKLVSRFGVRAVLGGGLLMMTAGMLLFTKIFAYNGGEDFTLAVIFIMVPGVLTAAGIALSIVPSTIAATQGAKPGQAGLASGLVNTSRQIGGGLGLAVLITLAVGRTSHVLGQTTNINQALTEGYRLVFFIGAGLCAAAALINFVFVTKGAASQGSMLRRFPIAAAVVVAIGGFTAASFALSSNHGPPIGAYSTTRAYSFVSAPQLHPPKPIQDAVPPPGAKLAPGYIFLANFYDISNPPMDGQSGPLILDNQLQPVWFHPVPVNQVAANLSLQTYQGRPALSWWQGQLTSTGDTITGEDVVVNQHYQRVATLRGQDGWVLTLHELVIRGNDAWVTANKNISMNLSPWGGPYNGALIDSAVQEYNLKTGKLLYTWDALKHIPLSQSQASLVSPWDAYHVNSIDVPGDGTFVVSMRDTWAAYKVDIGSGKILWTLGGRQSNFKFGPGAEFEWQHDVKVYPGTSLMTVFDDHCCQITGGGTYVAPTGNSRGLVLKLNMSTHRATLADQYIYPHLAQWHPPDYMGSIEPVSGGNEFVGWGATPYFTEYTPAGKQVLDGILPGSDQSYRSYLEPWVGLPLGGPTAVAHQASGGHTTVYVSWNGATQVVRWRLMGQASGGGFVPVATVRKTGFETTIPASGSYRTFVVQALDSGGHQIGVSKRFGLS
ncbi:MAG TPA: MFS transporter [Solirubrobacteraceae bacterium]|nr:MFS transporter [Solirubrobacteraceae bacterium]